MKGQARIDFRTRRSASRVTSDAIQTKKITDNERQVAFIQPVDEVPFKPTKVQKPVETVRKSGRIVKKNLRQATLDLKPTEKQVKKDVEKRKMETKQIISPKKQKVIHWPEKNTETEKGSTDNSKQEVVETKEESAIADAKVVTREESKDTIITQKEIAVEITKSDTITFSEKTVVTNEITQSNNDVETLTICHQEENRKYDESVHFDSQDSTSFSNEHLSPEPADTPSPPSSLSIIEPTTPPTHSLSSQSSLTKEISAPEKTYLSEADKQRIENEKSTLEKLRKALDITITDRIARNRPTLYHQIESILRNSTRRNITLSHICKIIYIVPTLYSLSAKELRTFGGKVSEAFLIEVGKEWEIPFAGKDLQKRADLLEHAVHTYFKQHKEPDATIPEAPLPRLAVIVDKQEWIKQANLPPGVKKLIEAHEKVKEAEIEKEKEKPKPTGTVKERMAALRARLAEKKKTSS